MPDEITITRLTHRRTETPSEIRIVVNTLYQTSLIVLIVLTLAGLLLEINPILYIGSVLLIAQWLYSLTYWNPVFREIKKARAEKCLTASGSKRSLDHPLTYVIQKGPS